MEFLALLLPISAWVVLYGLAWLSDARSLRRARMRGVNRSITEQHTDEDQVLDLCAEIQRISEAVETLPGAYMINPEPTRLELALGVGPAAAIRLNQELIDDIQDQWDLQVQLEREAREKAKADRAAARFEALRRRRQAAKLALAERKFKWWHRRALRGKCCAACFGEHPTEICVGDRFRAKRVPSSVLSPYSEHLGMYGTWETPDLTAHEPSYLMKAPQHVIRSWDSPKPVRTYSDGGLITETYDEVVTPERMTELASMGFISRDQLRTWMTEYAIRQRESDVQLRRRNYVDDWQ